MKKQFIIEVTQEDIDAGIIDDCWDCPVALAARRTFKEEGVSVSTHCICHPYKGVLAPTPLEVKTIIQEYDKSYRMSPFSFVIECDL